MFFYREIVYANISNEIGLRVKRSSKQVDGTSYVHRTGHNSP